MTYQICYNGYVMFDIEYYMTKDEISKKWHSEIHSLPRVEGLGFFLKDSINDSRFLLREFIDDAHEIEELRGLLYERYGNKPTTMEEASEFHDHVFLNVLEKIIEKFATKYNLHINRD